MSLIPNRIKAIIFDLDDTLYDCSGSLVLKSRKLAARTIANSVNISEMEALKLQLKLEERYGPDADIFSHISKQFNLSDKFYDEITINKIDLKGIRLFPDVADTIDKLKEAGYKLILVTAGKCDIQEGKIKELGLEDVFDESIITYNLSGKEKIFKEILIKYTLKPGQILCVGDKIENEIEIGKKLGMSTAIIKHGRHYDFYKSISHKIGPDVHISRISDLLRILTLNRN